VADEVIDESAIEFEGEEISDEALEKEVTKFRSFLENVTPDEFAFIRSSAKPFQLAPFVASGRFDAYDFPNPTESLAIMAASHSGEDRHVRTVAGRPARRRADA